MVDTQAATFAVTKDRHFREGTGTSSAACGDKTNALKDLGMRQDSFEVTEKLLICQKVWTSPGDTSGHIFGNQNGYFTIKHALFLT